MKAREWLDRGRKASSPLDAFRDFWAGFNNLYASNATCREQIKIRDFLLKVVTPASAREILASNVKEIDYLMSRPVFNVRRSAKDTTAYIVAFQGADDPLEKLVNVFMVIYQVRCNLIHGDKSPARDRDVQLCAYSAPVVAAVVERYA